MIKVHDLINAQIQYKASDLILKVNSPPIMRVNGDLKLLDLPPVSKVDIETGLIELLTKKQVEEFQQYSMLSTCERVLNRAISSCRIG